MKSDKHAFWRLLTLLILLTGAAGSLWCMFRTGNAGGSVLLMVLFTGWVLSPFMALFGYAWSKGGVAPIMLGCLTLIISLGSLAGYSGTFSVPGTRPAFIFLMLPLASWLVILLVYGLVRRHVGKSEI